VVVEAEEIEPFPTNPQTHDARFRFLRLQPEIGQQVTKPLQGSVGLFPRSTHHHHVIGEPHHDTVLARGPGSVDPVQEHVAEQGTDDPALRCAGHRPTNVAVLHHPGTQNRAHEP
jgi:hypothetical protein